MSTCISREVSCPRCGAANQSRMWIGVESSQNPELRARLLDGTFFDWRCPDCGYEAKLVYPCLYHDRENRAMICLAPNGEAGGLNARAQEFPGLESVKMREVATPEELKEKILIFEAGLDDLAVEAVKLALLDLVEKKKGCRADRAFFLVKSEELDYIGFSVFLRGAVEPIYQGTRLTVYERSLEALEGAAPEDGAFLRVDAPLAETLLEDIRQD